VMMPMAAVQTYRLKIIFVREESFVVDVVSCEIMTK
jgi:hypothetical protein